MRPEGGRSAEIKAAGSIFSVKEREEGARGGAERYKTKIIYSSEGSLPPGLDNWRILS